MLRSIIRTGLLVILGITMAAPWGAAQERVQQDYDDDYPVVYGGNVRIDRYLDVEIWPNHSDGDYFIGDDIRLSFRASRDCFVAIYSIDTRGRVNLLFPSSPVEDNFIVGSETYTLPMPGDDYDLVVTGPEGFEHIQIIASRERFPIPNWYRNSGLVDDWEDRYDFMDYLNGKYFVDYGGQRFAYDRAVIYVNEWEPYYYRPIHYPYYPHWTVVGNAYVDYGWGYSVYVNGIYWGCTPLYIPRLAIGWHTVTIYDPHGHCWEDDIHVTHYNTIVLNKTVVNTSAVVKSKYKVVRQAGYQKPVNAGYKTFKTRNEVVGKIVSESRTSKSTSRKGITTGRSGLPATVDSFEPDRKYSRGSSTLVKTNRGYEPDLSERGRESRSSVTRKSTNNARSNESIGSATRAKASRSGGGSVERGSSSRREGSKVRSSGRSSSSDDGYYRKTTGSERSKASRSSSNRVKNKTSKRERSSGTVRQSERKSSGSGGKTSKRSSSGTVKKSAPSKSSSSGRSSGSVEKSSSGNKSSSGSKTSSSGKSSGGSRKSGGGKSKTKR